MARMTSIYIGVSGLQSSQTALNTTTHNLANVYTEGYTRQLSFTSDRKYNTYGHTAVNTMQVGTGVSTSSTSRVRDLLLDRQYRTESGRQGFYSAQYEAVNEIETIIGETEGIKYQDTLENLWSAINEMSKTPDSIVSRSELVMCAETFLDRSKAIYRELIDYQKNLNTKVQNTVDKINELGDRINELNLKISGVETGIENANDLRDKRDLLLDELSKYIKISYSEDENHYVSVKVEGIPLVTEGGVFHMETKELDGDKSSTFLTCVWPQLAEQEVFNLNVKVDTAEKNDIGTLKGYLLARGDYIANYRDIPEVEDYDTSTPEGIKEYQAAVDFYNRNVECCAVMKAQALFDKLVNGIVTTINDILSPTTSEVPDGVTVYTDKNGNNYNASEVKILDMTTSTGDDGKMPPEELFSREVTERYIEVTGNDGKTYYMYNELNTFGNKSYYSVPNLVMNQTILEDYSKLPFKTAEGDSDLKKGADLVKEWNTDLMNLDPANMSKLDFKEFYGEFIYTIGNKGDLLESIAYNQQNTADQIQSTRVEIMGVSSEEELSNMIKYQSAYNAASRYVTTIADMLEYIIERLGA